MIEGEDIQDTAQAGRNEGLHRKAQPLRIANNVKMPGM
jgi:hypothetical protein